MADSGLIQRKPGALSNGASLLELPILFRWLQDQMLPNFCGDRAMAHMLSLVLPQDEQAVLNVATLALTVGLPT